jgi:hypothetical protein
MHLVETETVNISVVTQRVPTCCLSLIATWFQQKTIGISGRVLLQLGKRQLQCRCGLTGISRQLGFNLSVPEFANALDRCLTAG